MKMLEPCTITRMLIVDDEELILKVFTKIIGHELPYLVLDTAKNGAEALDIFGRLHHELLIMDLHMPIMNGQQAFMQMRDLCNARQWGMPSVVFCTAYKPSSSFQDNVINNDGRNCLLKKPVRVKDIVGAVRDRISDPH